MMDRLMKRLIMKRQLQTFAADLHDDRMTWLGLPDLFGPDLVRPDLVRPRPDPVVT